MPVLNTSCPEFNNELINNYIQWIHEWSDSAARHVIPFILKGCFTKMERFCNNSPPSYTNYKPEKDKFATINNTSKGLRLFRFWF